MTRTEFGEGMVYLAAGIGKEPPEGAEMPYFDLLGHLSKDVFLQACRNVMSRHKWATFPTVAEMLEAVREIETPAQNRMTAAEAFALAQRAAVQIDPRVTGPYRVKVNGEWQEFPSQADFVFARLGVPEPVQRAIEVFGVDALCNTDEPIGVTRSHFAKMFDELSARERLQALLPPDTRKAIAEETRDRKLINQALASIGKEVK